MARYKPVDYDPFAAPPSGGARLKPVDYDPFAKPKPKPKKKEEEPFYSGVIPTLKGAVGDILSTSGLALQQAYPTIAKLAPQVAGLIGLTGAIGRTSGQEIKAKAEAELPEASRAERRRQQEFIRTAKPGLGSEILSGIGRAGAALPSFSDYDIGGLSRQLLPQTPEDAARALAAVQAPFQTSRGASEFIASQAPATLIPLGGGKAIQLGTRALLPRAGREAAEATLAKELGTGVAVTGGAINAASAGSQAYEDVLAKGGTQEEADRAFKIAYLGAAAVSGVAARMPGLEQQAFTGGPTTGGVLRSAGRAVAGEVPQEFVEEGGSQLATNIGKIGTAAEVPIGEDVLSSAILGGIGGATIAAPIGGLQGLANRGAETTEEGPGAGVPPRGQPTSPPAPPADMGILMQALGPAGGKITLQEPSGPQEYTYQGIDEDGSVLLADADGLIYAEDPDQIAAAMKAGAAEPEAGLGAVAFGEDITEGLPEVEQPAAAVPKPVATPPAPEAIRTVTTPGGTKVNTAFEVVEADDLVPATGDLQNRDRTRAATDVQVQDIFSNFDPERLGESLESDRGSPIIGPDNVVESGNGRVMAINKVYNESPERADAYRNFIQGQGYDTTGYQRPVLVRRRVDALTPEGRSQFVRESNMDTKLRLSTSEQAGTDAAALTADVMGLMASPDVNQAVNRDFVRGFLSKLPVQEQAAFLDKNGNLSAEGSRRLRTAIKASAYGDADLINTLDESQDNNIKSIGGALEDVAPSWRTMRDAVSEGRVRSDMDVTDQLVEAAKIVRDVRNSGQKINDFLAQQDAFNPLDPVTERFIRSFYNQKSGRASGREAIGDILDKYARRAQEQTTEDQLFAAEPLSPEQVLDGIAGEKETDLFNDGKGVADNQQVSEVLSSGSPADMKNAIAKAEKPDDKIMNERANLQKQNRGCD